MFGQIQKPIESLKCLNSESLKYEISLKNIGINLLYFKNQNKPAKANKNDVIRMIFL